MKWTKFTKRGKKPTDLQAILVRVLFLDKLNPEMSIFNAKWYANSEDMKDGTIFFYISIRPNSLSMSFWIDRDSMLEDSCNSYYWMPLKEVTDE